MKPIQECIQNIIRSIGEENISLDKASRIHYRITHGPEAILYEDLGDFTPGAVVRLRTTEDVVTIVKYANKCEISFLVRENL